MYLHCPTDIINGQKLDMQRFLRVCMVVCVCVCALASLPIYSEHGLWFTCGVLHFSAQRNIWQHRSRCQPLDSATLNQLSHSIRLN